MFGDKEKTKWKFALGIKVKDKVSGLIGVTSSRTEWLNGCRRYAIQPSIDKDGKMVDAYYVDEEQVEVLEEEKVDVTPSKTGGPNIKVPNTGRF